MGGDACRHRRHIACPSKISTTGFGAFFMDRVRAIEGGARTLTTRQVKKLLEQVQNDPDHSLASESFRVHQADMELQHALRTRSLF